jgi:hypothetical protein
LLLCVCAYLQISFSFLKKEERKKTFVYGIPQDFCIGVTCMYFIK